MKNGSTSPGKVHIADINFPSFYAEVFRSLDAAKGFYRKLEELPPEKNAAKIVFHQAARMVWLADQIDTVARGRPAFQILFYLIAAELIAKIAFGFKGEGQSRKYVQRFFSEICSDRTKARLGKSFWQVAGDALSAEQAVDLLYRIRCDVVHKGMYYGFHLQEHENSTPQAVHVGKTTLATNLTILELRQMVLEGAVLASKRLLLDAGTHL